MKKAIKIVLGTVLALVAFLLVLVLALPLWIGPVATGLANAVVPGITGTDFTLGEFALNPYSGVLRIGAMELSNPKTYREKTAVRLDRLAVDLGMTTMCGDVLHVEDVALDGLYVYVSDLAGGNFQAIANHATGGKPKAEPATAPAAPAQAEEKKPEVKICIDRLALRNIRIKIGPLPPMPVPSLELRDLGKPKDPASEGGITFGELWKIIVEKVMAAAGATGKRLKVLGALMGDGAAATGAAAGQAADAVGEGAKKAADAVGEGAKATGAAAGKAVDAVSDDVKKTVEVLKSLF